MKKWWYLLGVLSLAGIVFYSTGCKKQEEEQEEETQLKWVVIGYMDGNNNLDESDNGTSYVIRDVQELEKVGSTEEVKIVVAVGSKKKGGIVKYYEVEKHENELPDSLSSRVLEDLGSKDMSDPRTLKDFIQYVRERYKAAHYLLILDDHGGGWRGCCVDEVQGSGDMMRMTELAQVLRETNFHPDIIVFHACLMGMVEVAYELKDLTDYVVASEFSMPMLSVLNPVQWLGELVNNPDMSSLDLAKKIAQAVYDEGVRQGKTVHMAVIKTSQMQRLGSKLGLLGNDLVTQSEQYANEIYDAWQHTHVSNLDDPNNVDIREFVKNLKQEPNLGNIQVIKDRIDSVIAALNDAVPFTKTNAQMSRCGMTIYLPIDHDVFAQDSAQYVALKFKETNWYSFVSKFSISTGGGGGGTSGDTVYVSGNINDPNYLGNYYFDVIYSHDQQWDQNDPVAEISLGNNTSFNLGAPIPEGYTTNDYVEFLAYSATCVDADGDGQDDDVLAGFYPVDQNGNLLFPHIQQSFSNITIDFQFYFQDACQGGKILKTRLKPFNRRAIK